MYTLYACLCLNKALKVAPETTIVKTFDTNLGGTSANLTPNEFITLKDLYYGLMLPSGNDAAFILASYYGCWLLADITKTRTSKVLRVETLGDKATHLKMYVQKFMQYMNRVLVKEILRHKTTKFENPHGLSNKNQVSNVWELSEACFLFLKNEVRTLSYIGF